MKTILQIISILVAICFIFFGIYIGVTGLSYFLEELRKINEEIYYGIATMLCGFFFFIAGTSIIKCITKSD